MTNEMVVLFLFIASLSVFLVSRKLLHNGQIPIMAILNAIALVIYGAVIKFQLLDIEIIPKESIAFLLNSFALVHLAVVILSAVVYGMDLLRKREESRNNKK